MQVSLTTTVAYLGPEGTFTEEALVGQADLAMYAAKDTAGSHYRWAPILEPVS